MTARTKAEKVLKKRRNAAWAQWYESDPESAKAGAQAMYDYPDDKGRTHGETPLLQLAQSCTLDGYIRVPTFSQIRAKCLDRKIPFDITRQDLPVPKICEVLGIPLFYSGSKTDNNPEVDRLIPAKGYVRGNVRVISARANRLKQDATVGEVRAILRYMERHSVKAS